MMSPVTDVKCFHDTNRDYTIFQDVFANYIGWNTPKTSIPLGSKPYNVLIIGVDSVSKLNFLRVLRNTYKLLVRTNWVHFVAYNKVGENTLPNLMALLTGKVANSETYNNVYYNSFFDKEKFIWNDYGRLGYITAFAEDCRAMSTFNNANDGFSDNPTDFYFRPYTIAMEKLLKEEIDGSIFSVEGRIIGDRILQLATELPNVCKGKPYFGLFWMNSFSHGNQNTPQLMDGHLVTFFEDLQKSGVFNNTILIFLSDHGMRFGEMRRTIVGVYEDRMPFLFVRVPDLFRVAHPKEYQYLIANSKKLTSTFDLYKTLQHILQLSKLNYILTPAKGCPNCSSIFEEFAQTRSCSEAGIDDQFCACTRLVHISKYSLISKVIAKHVVRATRRIIDAYPSEAYKCHRLQLSQVLHARMEEQFHDKNSTQFFIMLETSPNTTLEAVVSVVLNNSQVIKQTIIGGPYRIDGYEDTGSCCADSTLRKFCYCLF